MGKDPSEIRAEIERTREEMAGTVDALAYKTDVKERAKDRVRGLTDKPRSAMSSVKDNIMGKVQDHAPDKSTVQDAKSKVTGAPGQLTGGAKTGAKKVGQGAQRVGGVVKENPVGLALGGLALGFLTGTLLPSTRLEDEKLGTMADQLKDTVKETGSELLDHGKEVATAAAGAAQDAVKDTVKEQGPDHAKELGESAKEKAGDVRSTVGSSAR